MIVMLLSQAIRNLGRVSPSSLSPSSYSSFASPPSHRVGGRSSHTVTWNDNNSKRYLSESESDDENAAKSLDFGYVADEQTDITPLETDNAADNVLFPTSPATPHTNPVAEEEDTIEPFREGGEEYLSPKMAQTVLSQAAEATAASVAVSESMPEMHVIFNPISGAGDAEDARQVIREELSGTFPNMVIHETTKDISAHDITMAILEDLLDENLHAMDQSFPRRRSRTLSYQRTRSTDSDSVRNDNDDDEDPADDDDGEDDDGEDDDALGRSSSKVRASPTVEGSASPSASPNTPATATTSSYHNRRWTIVVSGGDGSIHEVVSALCAFESGLDSEQKQQAFQRPKFGVLPRGTGNAFALALGIPSNLRAACALIAKSQHVRCLDVAKVELPSSNKKEARKSKTQKDAEGDQTPTKTGEQELNGAKSVSIANGSDAIGEGATEALLATSQITERYCVLLAGMGQEAQMTLEASDRNLKRTLGVFAYLWGGAKATFTHRKEKFEVCMVLDGVRDNVPYSDRRKGAIVEMDAVRIRRLFARSVVVAQTCPPSTIMAQGLGDIIPDDGLLEMVCFAPETFIDSIWGMLDLLTSGLFNLRVHRRDLFALRAKKIRVTCHPPQMIALDGEIIGNTPIQLECKKQMIDVIAPSKKKNIRKLRRFRNVLKNLQGALTMVVGAFVIAKLFGGRHGADDETEEWEGENERKLRYYRNL